MKKLWITLLFGILTLPYMGCAKKDAPETIKNDVAEETQDAQPDVQTEESEETKEPTDSEE